MKIRLLNATAVRTLLPMHRCIDLMRNAMSLVASILSAIVLGKVIYVAHVTSALYGVKIGFAVWLGFVTTVQLTNALFMRQPFKLYLINTGYQFVCYLAMGAILGGWR